VRLIGKTEEVSRNKVKRGKTLLHIKCEHVASKAGDPSDKPC
jgi:hypothetical protein